MHLETSGPSMTEGETRNQNEDLANVQYDQNGHLMQEWSPAAMQNAVDDTEEALAANENQYGQTYAGHTSDDNGYQSS